MNLCENYALVEAVILKMLELWFWSVPNEKEKGEIF